MELLDNEIPDVHIMDHADWRFDLNVEYYLAGPMSGYPQYNFNTFTTACYALRDAGIKVLSPHEIDFGEAEGVRGQLPYETYMQAGLDLLEKCSGIILLAGWPQSTGTLRELARAIELDMPVYFYLENYEWDDAVRLVSMNKKVPA